MAPSTQGRPPGAPRKAVQGHTTSSRPQGQTSASISSLGPTDESSHPALFTMPRIPSDALAHDRQDASSHTNGPANWLSQRAPGQHDHDQSSSAIIETPTSRQRQGPLPPIHRAAPSHTQAYTTPSLVRQNPSKLYQDLTRGIAASRRARPESRISTASSGWGSPRFSVGQGGRPMFAAESGFSLDNNAAAGPSALPRKVPTGGIFNTPRTPSAGLAGSSVPRASSYLDANGSSLPHPLNQDGSVSVVRDEEDANNSGLLGMSPAVRRIQGLGLAMTPANVQTNGSHFLSPSQPNGKAAKQQMYGRTSFESGSSVKANQSIIEHSGLDEGTGADDDEMQAMRARLLQVNGWDEPMEEDRTVLLELMRSWREDAMKHHLYDTAIFWGDKILSLETKQIAWNDAYNLATALFLTHRYVQAEHLLCTPLRLARKRSYSSREEDFAEEGDVEEVRNKDLDWEDEEAAVAATRQNSSLPPSMLARMGGVNAATDGENGDVSAARKRKERPFTTSGTGTGSEGTGESASLNEDVGAGQSIGDQVMHAWKEEQKVAMEEVRERELLPPDSVSLVSISIPCKYLAAQCMVRQEKYQEALDELSGWKNESKEDMEESYRQPSKDGLIKLSSSIWHLKGLIHLKLRNSEEAKEDFIKSLSLDVKNYESFDQLIRGNLLTSSEQWSLIEGLHFVNQSGNDSVQLEALQLVQMVYTTRLDKTGKLHAQQAAAARRQLIRVYGMDNNADILLGLAEEMFARMKYEDAYTVTKRIMEVSKDHEASLPIYISTMYMIPRLRPTLFLVAHHLTETDPNLPAAWYAVGCWYLGTKQWLEARKYFSKCVQMDPRFAPGWIAFAHTFSYEGESDQAIVSYSTAERLFSSNHLIKLFVGMEHLNQANLTLAEIYLQGSAALWEEDALSRNERGVVQYYRGNIEEAIKLFESALQAAKDVQQPAEAWSTTRLNLGFAYRRVRQTEKAIKCFLQVTELDPDSGAAYLGLGMCYHRLGNLDEAVLWYHRSLAITTNDKQTSELLTLALEESAKVIDLSPSSEMQDRRQSAAAASTTSLDFVSRADWIEPSPNHTADTITMDEGDLSASTQMDESS